MRASPPPHLGQHDRPLFGQFDDGGKLLEPPTGKAASDATARRASRTCSSAGSIWWNGSVPVAESANPARSKTGEDGLSARRARKVRQSRTGSISRDGAESSQCMILNTYPLHTYLLAGRSARRRVPARVPGPGQVPRTISEAAAGGPITGYGMLFSCRSVAGTWFTWNRSLSLFQPSPGIETAKRLDQPVARRQHPILGIELGHAGRFWLCDWTFWRVFWRVKHVEQRAAANIELLTIGEQQIVRDAALRFQLGGEAASGWCRRLHAVRISSSAWRCVWNRRAWASSARAFCSRTLAVLARPSKIF